MKNFIKKHLFLLELGFIFFLGLIPLLWYKDGYVGFGHDMGFPLAPLDYFIDRLFTWSSRAAPFGANQTDSINGVFIHGIEGLFSFLGLSLVNTQKLTFIFWFTLPGITMYAFLKSLYPKKEDSILRLSGSSFYMMNHYLLQAWTIAERTKFSIVAALPLLILFIINVLYRKKSILQNSILFSFTLFFLNGGAGIPLYGGLAVALVGCLIGIFYMRQESFWGLFKRTLMFFMLSGAFMIIINAYWIFPYVESFTQNYTNRVVASGGENGAAKWSWEISKNASYINLLRLQGLPEWYENPDHPYSNSMLNNPFLVFISIVTAIIMLIGVFPYRGESRERRLFKYSFLVIIVLAIPFSAGSHPPFGKIYDWLLQNLPGFSIFRTPIYKFGMALWFSYACLVALGLKQIVDFFINRYTTERFKISLVSFLIFIIGLSFYNYPFFTGIFFDWSKNYSTMVKVPPYVFQMKDYLEDNNFSTRTLSIPEVNSYTSYVAYDWGYFSLSSVPEMLTRESVILNDAYLNKGESDMVNSTYDQLRKTGSSNILPFLGAEEILLMDDMNPSQNVAYSTKPLINSIRQNFPLKEVFGNWEIYSVTDNNILPLIYLPDEILYVNSTTKNLGTIIDIASISARSAFILDENNKINENLVKGIPYSKYILEGYCENCTISPSYQIPTRAPRIMPGSRLYPIVKYIDELKLQRINESTQKIDFFLGNMAKKVAAIDSTINDNNDDVIKDILLDLKLDFDKIGNLHSSIKDPGVKKESSIKIYEYIRYFAQKSQEWENNKVKEEEKKIFQSFIVFIKRYITKQNLFPREELSDTIPMVYTFTLLMKGEYEIFVADRVVEPFAGSITITEENGKQIPLTLGTNKDNIFFTKPLTLDKGIYKVNLYGSSRNYVTTKTLESLLFTIKPGRSECKNIPIENPDPGISQKISFNYDQSLKDSISAIIYESNSQFKNKKAIQYISAISGELGNVLEMTADYIPSKYVEEAVLTICIDSYNPNIKFPSIKNINFKTRFSQPNVFMLSNEFVSAQDQTKLDFVSLNQTAYLVRTKGSSPINLQFNNRFDENWKIREIDSKSAAKYFKGKSRVYLDGVVREYEKQDSHILTDLIFPIKKNSNTAMHLQSNSLANMWIIEEEALTDERIFLLEYSLQDRLYKAVAVSIIAFSILTIVYFICRKYEKN